MSFYRYLINPAIRALRHGILDIGVEHLVWLGDPTGLASTHDLQNNIEVHAVNTSVEQEGMVYHLATDITMDIIESAGCWGVGFYHRMESFPAIASNPH